MIDKPDDKDIVKFDELLILTMHLQETLIELLTTKVRLKDKKRK